MHSTPSVVRRAALAVALLVGFYLLAIAIAVALLCIPVLEYRLVGRVEGRLAIFAVFGAGAILWAIVPRIDRFEDPGPRLLETDHPRLFAAIRRVARDTGQAMPSEVFLVAQLNAWVAQRGGIMSFGSRRVMGLGLPLMEALSVQQFRAVLAHEFGHYYGGDTRLGPWIYKTRAAIERTLQGLHRHSTALAKPFQWYGQAFVRITHGVSRQQEFSADALAARTVGARPLAEGLRLLHGSDGAFSAYWSQELVPVLQLGARPPLAAGFRQFMGAPEIRAGIDEAIERELAQGEAGPYDTHPCLRDRLAAVATLPPGEAQPADPPALTLLEAPEAVEAKLIAFLGGPEAPALEPVAWSDVGLKVWLPFWRARARAHAPGLAGLTPADLPEAAKDLGALATRMGLVGGGEDPSPEHALSAGWGLAVTLIVVLAERGWTLNAMPGETVTLGREGDVIRPFALMHALGTGELPASEWLAMCVRLQIADLDLGAALGFEPGAGPGTGASRPWSFIAMTYYGLVLNRTFRVFVTERAVIGARVRGIISAPGKIGPQHGDPEYYVNPKLDAAYAELDPESEEFAARDGANFRIERDDIERIELIERAKWGMGSLPSAGRIVLHLRGGGRRELILLGRPNAAVIVRGLTRTAAAVMA
jgi:heat shock protein HtpX